MMKKIIAFPKHRQLTTLKHTNLGQTFIRSWEKNNTEFIKKIAKKLPCNSKILDVGSGDFRNSVNLIKNGMKYNKGNFKCYGIDNGGTAHSNIFTEKDLPQLMAYFEWLSCIKPSFTPIMIAPTISESSLENKLHLGLPKELDAALLYASEILNKIW